MSHETKSAFRADLQEAVRMVCGCGCPFYTSEKPRRKHPKSAKRGTATHLVPMGCLNEGWQTIAPMAINLNDMVVVTVLPLRKPCADRANGDSR